MKYCILLALILFNITVLCRGEFQVGAGKRVVTPDPLLPVSGGIGTSHPTTQKLGNLWVRAMVLDKDGSRMAIVGADFLGFPKVRYF